MVLGIVTPCTSEATHDEPFHSATWPLTALLCDSFDNGMEPLLMLVPLNAFVGYGPPPPGYCCPYAASGNRSSNSVSRCISPPKRFNIRRSATRNAGRRHRRALQYLAT